MSSEKCVPVTQADREFALQWTIPFNSEAGQDRKGVLAGKYDGYGSIQAVALHRLASDSRDGVLDLLREAMKGFSDVQYETEPSVYNPEAPLFHAAKELRRQVDAALGER